MARETKFEEQYHCGRCRRTHETCVRSSSALKQYVSRLLLLIYIFDLLLFYTLPEPNWNERSYGRRISFIESKINSLLFFFFFFYFSYLCTLLFVAWTFLNVSGNNLFQSHELRGRWDDLVYFEKHCIVWYGMVHLFICITTRFLIEAIYTHAHNNKK